MQRAFCSITLALALLVSAPAQARGPMEKADVALVADRTAYEPGSTATLAAVLALETGWHANSHEPTYDYLIPTRVTLEPPPGWPPAADPSYPPGVMRKFSFAEVPLSVYEGTVAIEARVEIPADAAPGSHQVAATVVYQACDDRSCLPPVTVRPTATLQVGPGGAAANREVFSQAGAGAAPSPPGPGLGLVLLLGLVGGLILNAMPCVLPVLSLKVLGLVRSAGGGRRHVVWGALATAAGIVLSFWALAGLAIAAKAAGGAVGWGVQFQEPAFVAALTVVILLFSLNLWGLFEIPLPATLARLVDSGPKEGLLGHLATGLFATLMATPCSAPFLGTALGFALAQPAPIILATFTAVALGMALPYLALAAWPHAVSWLPRPGPWMLAFKQIMGFLLAAAAVWLLYVLAAQIAPERLAFFELALLGLAFCVWLAHSLRRTSPRRLARAAALVVGGLGLALVAAAPQGGGGEAASAALAGEGASLISWRPFDRAAAEQLAAEGRLVFVDVTADWCFTCKVNERLVLETPEVAGAFERHDVLAMRADWTNRDDAIARFLADHGRYGIPFYLLYRPGADPHVFSELLTKGAVLRELEAAAPTVTAERPEEM